MRPIDADAALKALRKCQAYLYDARDPELKIELSSAEAAINNLPTIQPVATDTNDGDTISRQAAIDAIVQCTNCGDEDTLREYVLKHSLDNGWTGGILEALDAVKDLPSAQPEPAIPLSWIEKHIEWHKSLDSEFANLAAAHISVMVKKWRDEKK